MEVRGLGPHRVGACATAGVRNHALVDGDKRVGLTACALLLFKDDIVLVFGEDEMYDLVIAVAEGRVDVPQIADSLRRWRQ